jgi:hypothetical protein
MRNPICYEADACDVLKTRARKYLADDLCLIGR